MASLTTLTKRPTCLSCLRRTLDTDTFLLPNPTKTQWRGKKKLIKKRTTINVQLLQDVDGYGRRGTIVPVAPGLFRNSWQSRHVAVYASTPHSQLKPRDIVSERDFAFRKGEAFRKITEEEGKKVEPVSAPKVQGVDPQRATELLNSLLPAQLIFHRAPIKAPAGSTVTPSPDLAQPPASASQAAETLAAASKPAEPASLTKAQGPPVKPEMQPIFGSVSTADIAQAIKAVLAEDKEGKMVTIAPEDVSIYAAKGGGGVEGDRVKAIGEFQVVVKIKGGEEVTRIVSVRAMEKAGDGGFLGAS